jgi:hypothetical protein
VIRVEDDAEVGILSAIAAFSTYGKDFVALVNGTTPTVQSYFRKLSCMTREHKLPVAPTSYTSYEKPVKKEQLERVIAGGALSIIKPTTIYALLKFKKYSQSAALILTFDLANPKLSKKPCVKRCKEGNISIEI